MLLTLAGVVSRCRGNKERQIASPYYEWLYDIGATGRKGFRLLRTPNGSQVRTVTSSLGVVEPLLIGRTELGTGDFNDRSVATTELDCGGRRAN